MNTATLEADAIDLDRIDWSDWSDDPYPLYRKLRDEAPVWRDPANGMMLVTRYDDVQAVLRDFNQYSSIPLHLVGREEERISPLREADPPHHKWLRNVVMPLFVPREMRRLEPYFVDLSRELLDAAEQHDVVEVSSQLAIPLPGRVTCDILGLPQEAHQAFMDLTAERLRMLHSQREGMEFPAGTRSIEDVREDLWAIVAPTAKARLAEPRSDAISLLIQEQAKVGKDQLSDNLIIDMLLHLLTGGFHTTQHLVEMLMSLFADRPELWQQLRDDRSLVPVAIEEMLRWDAPVQALPRRNVVDMELAGSHIPRNSNVMVVYGSANRDERVFPDPDSFRLDRSAKAHFAFSAGIHFCPGAPVTRFEVKALFDEMLDRYSGFERMGPSERWVTEQFSVHSMHGYKKVPVRFIRG